MSRIDILRSTDIGSSARARQLSAIFDVPTSSERQRVEWHGDFPYDEQPWNVGLIVGPSGAGKSTILQEIFGGMTEFSWDSASVVDDFPASATMDEIAAACSAVGFNTIPAWLRPHRVLSVGERFRVDLARRLVELKQDPLIIDEFTSVVDRQVAKIGAHALQKWARTHERQVIAATCHYDIIDWLQPDWLLEPATMTFTRRGLQRRPSIDLVFSPVPYDTWALFAAHHYLTNQLNRSARCFALLVDERPVSFAAVLHRPNARNRHLKAFTRLVTLPDWQGLGLIFVLSELVASLYRALGFSIHSYPAHPAFIRGFDRSPNWEVRKRPASFGALIGASSTLKTWRQGSRPCATVRYVGPPMERSEAERIIAYWG